MSARSDELSATLLADSNSNHDLTAQTAQGTVMAEQVSHNVVNIPESTSASLADVSANTTIVPSADYGSATENLPETKTANLLDAAQATNQNATSTNELPSSMIADEQVISEAEPSAGDAAGIAISAEVVTNEGGLDNSGEYSQVVNGVHEAVGLADGQTDEEGLREGSVDVSLHSDTEGSRGDASELKKDEQHHVRTNSVKKPTSFSKVSVTKNFLAKSATSTTPIAKPGDKASPAGTPLQSSVQKPRLIAKTGTNLRDVQKARLGTESASGPDASKVWNKNRPVAPPPPKQFTDEELKQQYGIHLATRLQADENGKESKWADIDDDEDDWAPDTVVWMDGTKSTLTPTEAATLAQQEQKAAAPAQLLTKPSEGVKPIVAPKKIELGPAKTILKPGASAAAAQARQTESGANTPGEKASLIAKSPASLPSKSPWAVLPPIDKVSPVNPPVQQRQPPPMPFSSQDARAYEPAQPSVPAREIAADTFDRSWREGEGGTRELFNSANGRYEPVPEGGRRGSMKPDSAHRKPAVLQRPSPSGPAPAEPSAAFQTRSTSQQMDGAFTRRRGSSVSHGSIPSDRKLSISRNSEMSPAPERRTSTVVGHDMRTSPKLARVETSQPPSFSQQSVWQQQMPPRPESGDAEVEDPVKVQERVMREKRELAKKRREEEEARLEAEKKARLEAKLAGLGSAGKSRKEREAEAAAAAAAAAVQTPSSDNAPQIAPAVSEPVETQPREVGASAEAAPLPEAQSILPVPDAVPVKQPTSEEALPAPLPPKDPSAERRTSATEQMQRDQTRLQPSPRANARAPFQQTGVHYKASSSSYSSPGERKQQPFGRSPIPNNDTFGPWASAASSGNVWGTSGIGNGTFEGSSLFAPMPTSQQGSALPPPPGMTRAAGSSRISPQSLGSESRSPNLNQHSVPESSRTFAAPPGLEGARPDPFAGRGNGTSPVPGLGRQLHLPGPIAPPSRAAQQQNQQQQPPAQRPDALSAWNSAAQSLPHQYKADAAAAEQKTRESIVAPRDDTFKETFRQTAADQGKLGAPRKYDKTEFTIHDAQGSRSVQTLSPVPPSSQTQPSGPFSATSPMPQDPRQMVPEKTVRMPDPTLNPAHGGHLPQQPPIAPPHARKHIPQTQSSAQIPSSAPRVDSKDPSPPPPETAVHPVNSGDVSHPLVKLPPEKPKVKLPPSQSTDSRNMGPPHSVVLPQRPYSNAWGPPGSSKPIVMQEAWQARFNGLFGRAPIQTETPPSPPKTPPKMQLPSPTVTASTRAVMDDAPSTISATVSLPSVARKVTKDGFSIDDSSEATSKPTIQQMFMEEQSFGSAPRVHVPRSANYNVDTFDEPPSYNMLQMLSNRKDVPLRVFAHSEPIFDLTQVHPKRREGIFASIPGTKLVKRLIRSQQDGRKASTNVQQDRKALGKFNGKGKDGASNTPAPATSAPAVTRNPSSQKDSTPASNSPAPSSNATTEAPKKTAWAKPPKGPPRGRGRGPPTVKAA